MYKDGNDWYKTLHSSDKKSLEGSVIYDDYFEAILGKAKLNGVYVLVYSVSKIIENLECQFKDMDDPYTGAVEFFDFNIIGGWLGERTPLCLYDGEADLEELDQCLKDCNKSMYIRSLLGEGMRCGQDSVLVYKHLYKWHPDALELSGDQCYNIIQLEKLHARKLSEVRAKARRKSRSHHA